jgi:hypothetical protein
MENIGTTPATSGAFEYHCLTVSNVFLVRYTEHVLKRGERLEDLMDRTEVIASEVR